MLSRQSLEQVRRLSPRERLRQCKALIDFSMRMLQMRPREHQDRVWDVRRRLDQQSDQAYLTHLRRYP